VAIMQRKTIIISSHILPELAEMVDEIGVIEHGKLIAKGKIQDIQNRMQANRCSCSAL
jgi:ABC-2 type transport system ATP-binding protein